jgi:CBS domain-containing protein
MLARTVADAIRETVFVAAASTLKAASESMLDAHTEAAVVLDGGRLAGILTAANVADALAEGREPSTTPVGDVADPDPPVVRADEPLVDAHERMSVEQRDIGVAVAGNGEPLGLLLLD